MEIIERRAKTYIVKLNNGKLYHISKEIYDSGDTENIEEHMIPYSLPFDELIVDLVHDSSEEIMGEFFKLGIHTEKDILNNRRQTQSIFNRYLSTEALLKKIRSIKEGE